MSAAGAIMPETLTEDERWDISSPLRQVPARVRSKRLARGS